MRCEAQDPVKKGLAHIRQPLLLLHPLQPQSLAGFFTSMKVGSLSSVYTEDEMLSNSVLLGPGTVLNSPFNYKLAMSSQHRDVKTMKDEDMTQRGAVVSLSSNSHSESAYASDMSEDIFGCHKEGQVV